MQASGLPKLKFKCTDSFKSGEASDYAVKGLVLHIKNKPSRTDRQLTHCSKHQGSSWISIFYCTPGNGGVQEYICQSITPTSVLTKSSSPLGPVDYIPWVPSPRSQGRLTPRLGFAKARARTGLLGTKEIKNGAESLETHSLTVCSKYHGEEAA